MSIPCPRCGQHRSEIKETRARAGVVRRRRQCFNLHSYWTEERALLPFVAPATATNAALPAATGDAAINPGQP